MMATSRSIPMWSLLMWAVFALAVSSLSSCAKKVPAILPPTPIDFAQALQYAQRAALAYEPDAVIQ